MADHTQTVIFMVRHGETDRYYSDTPTVDAERQLTENGREQMEKVGEYLQNFAPTRIYSSPLDRCRDSAEIISKITNAPLELTNQLLEIYSTEPRREAGERGESIFGTVLKDHAGKQVVAVTHQYIIGYVVADFLNISYHRVQCDFADIWRLVFANDKLVEATRLQPANQ